MNMCYGVDDTRPVTPEMVRDALVRCFVLAHQEAVKQSLSFVAQDYGDDAKKKLFDAHSESIVRNAFRFTDGDFNKPTKASIIAAMDYLKDFSKKYRDKDVIAKHYDELMGLVNKL